MKKRILVIDDEESVRKSYALALEDCGYNLDASASGEEGLKNVKSINYDLIFLDLKMPGLNGIDTLYEIRKKDKKVPVFIVTAFHREFAGGLKSLQDDGIDFQLLAKPIGRAQIIAVTRSALEGLASY
ncbi:MAG: hypothetical protein A2901_01810 [Elusimicrobia bacterium RIFCSPLOWO2_01_FULL_54_10]|nr:MAG: hypothetical protein A2901_01810 [Elusimicrobia bacterium RIFCSPLOWO2_01_FULL_54_10]